MTPDGGLVLAFEGQGARTLPARHLAAIAELVEGIAPADDPLAMEGLPPSVVQRAIIVHQVREAEASVAAFGPPRGVIGQSLGELSAMVVAGALPLGSALEIARWRADLPAEVIEDRAWTMATLTRMPVERATDALSRIGGWIVCRNGPSDVVVVVEGGSLATFLGLVGADESTCRVLPVPHPYHTPMMVPVAERLAPMVDAIDVAAPVVDVVSPSGPTMLHTADDVRRAIIDALTTPVEWGAALVVGAGRWPGACWHECGPSNGLRRFVWKNGLELNWKPAT